MPRSSASRDLWWWMASTILMSFYLLSTRANDTEQGTPCEFPVEWRGRYFQNGLNDIHIRENFITRKGACRGRSRDYFLIHSHEENCFRCMLIMQRHKNIIQYKESYCSAVYDNLKTLCSHIQVESSLYTMVKEPAIGVRCPLNGAYQFTFSDSENIFCNKTESHVKPCVGQTRYQMKFRDCRESAFNGKDLNLECLANWKTQSETYFYGRLTGMSFVEKDDRYRCFKYQHQGNEVSVTMSADSTCRGLRSSTDGPFFFKFTKDSSGFRQPSCQFPDWLDDITWRDLGGRHQFLLEKQAGILTEHYKPSANATFHQINEFRCIQSTEDELGDDQFIAYTYFSHKCDLKFQCIKLKRHATNVFTLHRGVLHENEITFESCLVEDYDQHQLLTANITTSSACPQAGVYYTTPPPGEQCRKQIKIGCRSNSSVEVEDICGESVSSENVFSCVSSWSDNFHETNILVQVRSTDNLQCFIVRSKENKIFGPDKTCASNAMSRSDSSYEITEQESCRQDTQRKTTLPSPVYNMSGKIKNNIQQTQDDDDDDDEILVEFSGDDSLEQDRSQNRPVISNVKPSVESFHGYSVNIARLDNANEANVVEISDDEATPNENDKKDQRKPSVDNNYYLESSCNPKITQHSYLLLFCFVLICYRATASICFNVLL